MSHYFMDCGRANTDLAFYAIETPRIINRYWKVYCYHHARLKIVLSEGSNSTLKTFFFFFFFFLGGGGKGEGDGV